jgi:nitroreductase
MDQIQTLLDIMYNRRSIRRFIEDKPVEEDKINLLLKAAMAAPSACNLQPWEFIVVNEENTLQLLKDCIGKDNGRNYNATAAFVVCGNTRYIPWESTGVMDCSAAIENILLAVTALDLGAVWIGDYDTKKVRELMDIPEHVAVNSLVLLGYPSEEKQPRTQYKEEAVYWQKYEPNRAHDERTTAMRFL